MQKLSWMMVFLCLYLGTQAQGFTESLHQIENNNKELKAFQFFMKAQSLKNKEASLLPELEVESSYLNGGVDKSTAYRSFDIKQAFRFPTYYLSAGKLQNLQSEALLLQQASLRQDILKKVSLILSNFVYLKKKKEIYTQRSNQAEKLFKQMELLYKEKLASLLDYQKARLAYVNEKNKLQAIENDIQNLQIQLKELNGEEPLEFTAVDYERPLSALNTPDLWEEKKAQDPQILLQEKNTVLAKQNVSVSRQTLLPELSLGYSQQGTSGDKFSGIVGGIRIPLWSGRNKMKQARMSYSYAASTADAEILKEYIAFKELASKYDFAWKQFQEYKEIITALQSEELLLEAYRLGEISFSEYYIEIQFYRDAYDALLAQENELQRLQVQLFKHRL